MASSRTIVLAMLNTLAFAVGAYATVKASMQLAHENPGCEYRNLGLRLSLGICVVLLALLGLTLTIFRSCMPLKYVYVPLTFMLPLAVMAMLLLVFFAGGVTKVDDEFENYSPLVRNQLLGKRRWDHVKRCMTQHQVCKRLHKRDDSPRSSIELCCCGPPPHCGLRNNNGSHWEMVPLSVITSKDKECERWSARSGQECLECNRCKLGYIATIHLEWGISLISCLYPCFCFMLSIPLLEELKKNENSSNI